jgi:transcriptional regulator with XRE-family HTH domain
LTQQQVSDLTGVPKRTIQNWEAGVRQCPEYVTKMVTDILHQKFGTPDHQMFLEELLEMLQSDLKHAGSEETKMYINNLIGGITEQLNK